MPPYSSRHIRELFLHPGPTRTTHGGPALCTTARCDLWITSISPVKTVQAFRAMTDKEILLDTPDAIRDHLSDTVEPEAGHGVRMVLCDDRNAVLTHVHIGEAPPNPDDEECAKIVTPFAHAMCGGPASGAMVLALTRPGPPTLSAADRRWFRTAHKVCAIHDIRLLGVHVVTPRGVREVLLDDAL